MSYYQVERPSSGRAGLAELAAAALVAAALGVLVFTAYKSVPVVVDDVRRRVPMGTPLLELAADGLTVAAAGDLLAASDGRVLLDGRGLPPALEIDGRPVADGETVMGPAVIESVPGADVVEEVEVAEEPIAMPVRYEGEGSLVSLSQTGRVGRRRVSRGAVSGQVLAMAVLEEPVAMVLTRRRAAPGDRVVALTFDDGPWPGQTEDVLSILEEAGVSATFFMLGVQVDAHPGIARAVVAAGHGVGNHTQTHRMLRRADEDTVRREIRAGQTAFRSAVGFSPVWFRPPGGLVGPDLFAGAEAEGVRVVGWTVDPQDWDRKTADDIADEVVDAVRPGAVVLLHDGGGDRSATIEALPRIISELRSKGYEFITLDEYPGSPARQPTG